ncbi:acyl-CoA dehydrogenase family protein [Sandaracinus amylolyticus]|uniref:Cyclohex-1-ene-1-carbonyl-CoA dehydrogenase n=1 Tax=Sandaracinus amylolyticus TaxID=927083 RepID=A0A0F6W2V0_9BACT|nr:acyl-CoA dehydrogenase family protein [Sandaracinus amylolyticus]AKF05883.1 Butyryl-CoA dehydrogenase [Sandaracinus amylolyticus]
MEFQLEETQRLVQETAREYATRAIAPRAREIDRDAHIPRALLAGLADIGLLGVNVPEALGGAGAGVVAYSLAMTEVAKACASTAVTMAVSNMVAEVIATFGTDAQRTTYVPRLCDGTLVAGSFALSEPEAGSDPGAMRTTARREGGEWVLDGSKQWITSGDFAGVFVVWARTGGPGTKGISAFLVEKDAPGLSVGHHEDKMGLRGSSTTALHFDRCRIPGSALLGQENGGFKIAMMALDGGRIGIASQALGIGEAALEKGIAYAKERKAFGAPIADKQAIQWMIADARTELDAARLLTLRAAWLKEKGVAFSQQAAMAKLWSSEAAWRVCDRALQIHGGYGYVKEYDVERHYRDVRVTRIYEGTSEVQRIVISRGAIG